MRDLRLALRRLHRSPGFTIFTVVTLALGIGAATAAYSALYTLALRPPGFDPAGLVLISRTNAVPRGTLARVSWTDYRRVRDEQRSLATLAAWTAALNLVLTSSGSSTFVDVEAVTGSYFGMLRIRPLLGRLLQPADEAPDAPPVLVLSESTWHSQFAGNPAVVGTSVTLAHRRIEIVGVAPAGFRGATTMLVSQYAGWVPLSFVPAVRDRAVLAVGGRLGAGRRLGGAAAELATLGRSFDLADPLPPLVLPGGHAQPRLRAWSAVAYRDTLAAAGATDAGRILIALPALVLLVACTNLTNLVLSRGTARRQAFAIRRALGGSQWRLIREEFGEIVLLAGAGGALGTLVTHAVLTWTVNTLSEPLAALAPAVTIEWRMQPVVFVAAGGAAVLAMLVGGLVPAWRLTRPTISRGLTADSLGALPRWRGRSNLIALQVAVSVTLFLLTAIAVRFTNHPPASAPLQRLGQGLDHLAVASVPLTAQQIDERRARATLDAIVANAATRPDVERVALANALPGLAFVGDSVHAYLQPVGEPLVTSGSGALRSPDAPLIIASPEIFSTLHLSAASGRLFTADDRAGAGRVIVLDRTLARRLFGQAPAVGRTVQLARTDAPDRRDDAVVIGVLAPSPLDGTAGLATDPGGHDPGVAYVPFAEHDADTMLIVARSRSGDPRALVGTLTLAIRRVDPGLAVASAGRADVMAAGPLIFLEYITTVTAGLATLALVLAMGGLYGVLSQVIAQRTREIGVRMALGAEPGRITRMVLRDGFRPVLEGLFIGLGSAWTIRQLAQMGFTATLSSIDPVLVATAAAPLLVAAAVAAWLPARRASRVDPTVALRDL
jgi:putative ABC transport system permease protein